MRPLLPSLDNDWLFMITSILKIDPLADDTSYDRGEDQHQFAISLGWMVMMVPATNAKDRREMSDASHVSKQKEKAKPTRLHFHYPILSNI